MNNSAQSVFSKAGYLAIAYGVLLALSLAFNEKLQLALLVLAGLAFLFYFVLFAKKYLPGFLVLCIPLSVGVKTAGGVSLDLPSEPLLGLLSLLFIVYALAKPVLKKSILYHPVTILLFVELGWMITCSLFSELPVVAFKRSFVRFNFLVIFYLLFAHWFEEPKRIKWLFILYGMGMIWPVIHGFIFHARFYFSSSSAYWMPRPFYLDHTVYGACLAFLIPAFLVFVFNAKYLDIRGWKFSLLVLLTALLVVAEILSFSRAAWVSLAGAFVFRLLLAVRIRLWMLLLLLFCTSLVVYENYPSIIDTVKRNEAVSNKGDLTEHLMSVTNIQSDASNLERVNRWICAIRMGKARPVFGFGPGTYQFIYGRFQSRADMTYISTFGGTNGHAHSEMFNALSEEGFPGMCLYLLLVFTVMGYGLKIIYSVREKQDRIFATAALLGLVTFYVHGFFNAFLDSDKMAVLVFGSIAVLVSIDIRRRQKVREAQLNLLNETAA